MLRFNIKKISAMAMAAAVMAQLTACGENTTWGAEADGVRIPAGVFIYYLQSAYYDAQSRISEEAAELGTEAADIFSSQIDGVSASDWIKNEATRSMKEYAAVEAKFDEYGLEIPSDLVSSVRLYCDQLWDYGGEYYTEMGISQKSYESVFLNGEKRDMLFETLYFEGGDYGVPDDEIKSYLDENYAMINYIEMDLKDGEGNLLKSDGKAERYAMAEEYIERYKSGEDFDSLNAEYVTYYQNLQDAAAEAAAQNDETDGGALTAEVNGSEANAPLDAPGDVLTDDDDDPAEDAAAEASGEDTDEAVVTDGADTEEDADAQPETEDGAAEPDEDDNADDAQSGDEPAGAIINPEDIQVNAVSSNQRVVDRESTSPNSEVVEAAFEMEKGDVRIIETADGEHYYVLLKMDILETDEYFENAKGSLLYEMRSDDYSDLVVRWTESQSFIRNSEAYERYAPEKIFAE